ncbi:MAG: hypothetical protein HN737_10260 [Desulfobacterales bacterium]|nr:hypothetical protein [Desulfobacteraceae bacterium]MBT7697778.1 hypothetical protein [Desulfobacterales bacterium]
MAERTTVLREINRILELIKIQILPILSYSLKDTVLIKTLNLFFGVVTGYLV